jgi:hypothetical protein
MFDTSEKRPNSCILEEFDEGQAVVTYGTLNSPSKKYKHTHRKLHKNDINACLHYRYDRLIKSGKKTKHM